MPVERRCALDFRACFDAAVSGNTLWPTEDRGPTQPSSSPSAYVQAKTQRKHSGTARTNGALISNSFDWKQLVQRSDLRCISCSSNRHRFATHLAANS
jgi:hypothetical protein